MTRKSMTCIVVMFVVQFSAYADNGKQILSSLINEEEIQAAADEPITGPCDGFFSVPEPPLSLCNEGNEVGSLSSVTYCLHRNIGTCQGLRCIPPHPDPEVIWEWVYFALVKECRVTESGTYQWENVCMRTRAYREHCEFYSFDCVIISCGHEVNFPITSASVSQEVESFSTNSCSSFIITQDSYDNLMENFDFEVNEHSSLSQYLLAQKRDMALKNYNLEFLNMLAVLELSGVHTVHFTGNELDIPGVNISIEMNSNNCEEEVPVR